MLDMDGTILDLKQEVTGLIEYFDGVHVSQDYGYAEECRVQLRRVPLASGRLPSARWSST